MAKHYTSEFISDGHPDKVADAMSDGVVDLVLDLAVQMGVDPSQMRCAIETMIKDNLIFLSGEINGPKAVLAEMDLTTMVGRVWSMVGYDHQGTPTLINHIKPQSTEIAHLVDADGLASGAGDQGIMCGFAHRGGQNMMPPEFDLSRALISRLREMRMTSQMSYLRSDAKSQVTIDEDGNVQAVIISTQHDDTIGLADLRREVVKNVVVPVLGDIDLDQVKINHKGSFIMGGSAADCGLTGRKIVCDAYGPRSQVGGGCFSGKDPSKVDRSAAYMARAIALRAMKDFPEAMTASVQLAYGIGQVQPTAAMAMTDTGMDLSDWVRDTFGDLSPHSIQSQLGLWERNGWSYSDTASMGHFGRDQFPWEQMLADD